MVGGKNNDKTFKKSCLGEEINVNIVCINFEWRSSWITPLTFPQVFLYLENFPNSCLRRNFKLEEHDFITYFKFKLISESKLCIQEDYLAK